jgi:hypothetical protein
VVEVNAEDWRKNRKRVSSADWKRIVCNSGVRGRKNIVQEFHSFNLTVKTDCL